MQVIRGTTRGLDLRLPSPVEELHDDSLVARGVRLYLKRDDLIHPELPGNKWRKLKYNLEAAVGLEHRTLLTFGGAYSNHIRATATAGSFYGLATIGVIRGERHEPLNPSLAYAASQGMTLTYLDRESYRRKHSAELVEALHRQFGDFYLVPEGGTNELGARGCTEIPQEIDVDFDVICCACGTGGTLAGIAAGLRAGQRAVGFSVLKGAHSLDREVGELQRRAFGANSGNWTIQHDFHFGGFARRTPDLEAFIASFEDQHALRLEWVYVAKMMSGVFRLVDAGAFPPGTSIVAVVTG
jgi:1-aminocyclopropane-1-carboxylate deaminase